MVKLCLYYDLEKEKLEREQKTFLDITTERNTIIELQGNSNREKTY